MQFWRRNPNSDILIFFHDRINKLVSEENTVPRALFEARKVAGSAKVSHKDKEFLYFVCLGVNKISQ